MDRVVSIFADSLDAALEARSKHVEAKHLTSAQVLLLKD